MLNAAANGKSLEKNIHNNKHGIAMTKKVKRGILNDSNQELTILLLFLLLLFFFIS